MAARAGVTHSTGSRVVIGSHRVSEVARAAIQAAVAGPRYLPHSAARARATYRGGGPADSVMRWEPIRTRSSSCSRRRRRDPARRSARQRHRAARHRRRGPIEAAS
ncbi:LacI family DNA-binding transcriptional regulator [Streptomyces himalayensis]|uniref:LacI family DNA-binding transcriptional regulator n=1 Tax=Streptomyces himalayensis TaxID=2820085 RepID=UPI0035E43DFF